MAIFSRLVAAATAALALLAGTASAEHIQYKLRNGEIASRAVNLGGWLVGEYWMAFSSPLYEGVPSSVGLKGDYAVMQHLGKTKGAKQFADHYATFITEEDIQQIAEYGLNSVRVTVGFWIMNDADDSNSTDTSTLTRSYPSGSLQYLDTLINKWAVKYDLAVMISLHAHRGSQNGFDNSAPEVAGTIGWDKDPVNVQSSLDFATFIAHRYKDSDAFLGMNLMNEPRSPIDYTVLKKYYTDAYEAIRGDGNDCIIVTSPWLENQGPPTMSDFMTCPEYYNVWHEWHIYYKWGWENVPKDSMLAKADSYADDKFTPWTGNPMYMGEWSLATIDEVQLTKAELTAFAKSQMDQYDTRALGGWAFWAWRHDEEATKNPSGWSMRQLLKEGIITIPTTPATRTRDPKCKAVFSHGSNKTKSSSSSGSASGSAGTSVELYKPETVAPSDGNNNDETSAPTSAPAPASAAMRISALPSLAVLVAGSLVTSAL